MSDTSNGWWWEWIALGVLFLIWFFFIALVASPHMPLLVIFVVSIIATVFTGGIIAVIIDFIKPIRDRPKTTSTSGNHSKTTFKIGDVEMKKSIDIVKEVFKADMKKGDKFIPFYIVGGFFIIFSYLVFFLSIENNELFCIAFMLLGVGILLLSWGLRHERNSNGYIVIMGSKTSYLVVAFLSLIPIVSFIFALFSILYPFLWVEEDNQRDRERLNRIKREYVDYFNNLGYSDIKEKIEKLKKGINVKGVLIFKLTEEGYKKLILACEMIKESKLEIYAPIEPAVSTVTQIYNIEKVGKYAECPYCSSNIRDTFYELGGIVRCDKCGAFHHKECFEYYGNKCGSSSCKLGNA